MLKRCLPAIALFLLAPAVGELLLGNLAFSQLPLFLPVLAPMYGGGALLIREVTRRAGRGPVTMLILGVAYGLVEEGLADQMLFNHFYAGHDEMGATYIPALGMGGWLTIGVLTMHAVWSTNAGIALVEALFPERAETPWLGRTGLGVTAAIFTLGTAVVMWGSYNDEHFFARPGQLIATVVAIVALVAVAFRVRPRALLDGAAPRPWVVGVVAFAAASLFLNTADLPGWWSVAAATALLVVTVTVTSRWCRRRGWGRGHRLGLAAGAILTYAWVGFGMTPETAAKTTGDYVVNVVLALGSVALIALAARRLHGFRPPLAADEEKAEVRF
ncbi:hypothetical protein GCM10027176_46930 [Actinoallomurus bryophytorum]|uniref:DUF998 domain-containing protein n=1 Tax=Actinoallomurus bryophytorum TaxID=1490222 RepID=A0A543CV10_9ACTN|nr:hypothetical protein [Actinoallomurus bryophytorum]TQM00945.1 hypothetical protein FB559_6684 [Actinoallomurus bryophytorum]